jgi:hypothetical protein
MSAGRDSANQLLYTNLLPEETATDIFLLVGRSSQRDSANPTSPDGEILYHIYAGRIRSLETQKRPAKHGRYRGVWLGATEPTAGAQECEVMSIRGEMETSSRVQKQPERTGCSQRWLSACIKPVVVRGVPRPGDVSRSCIMQNGCVPKRETRRRGGVL